MTRDTLLNRINDARKINGLSASAFCRAAGVDHKVIGHLKNGESVTLATIEKIESYILKNALVKTEATR